MELTADKAVGGELWAMDYPVSVYSSAQTSQVVYSVPKRMKVGVINSWVQRDGRLWWQLDSLNRWVIHEPGKFDPDKLGASIIRRNQERDKEIDEKAQERIDKADPFGNLMGGIGDFFDRFSGALIGVGAGVLLLIILKSK
jgi:hypothetical protein